MRRTVPKKHRQYARHMRNQPTDGEAMMWEMLRGRKLGGMRFRRQHPMAGYIVDFICLEEKLIIEVDGAQHAESQWDRVRDAELKSLGYEVLRFWNDEIFRNSDGVAQTILAIAGKPRLCSIPPSCKI